MDDEFLKHNCPQGPEAFENPKGTLGGLQREMFCAI